MAGQRKGGQKPDVGREDKGPIKDLDVRTGDVDKVKGGRRGDPCDGGEIAPR